MTNDYISNFYWTGYWFALCTNFAIMYYNFSIYLLANRNYKLLNLSMHPFTGSISPLIQERGFLRNLFSFCVHFSLILIASFFSWVSFFITVVGNYIEFANTPEKVKAFRNTMRRTNLSRYRAARANLLVDDAEASPDAIRAHLEELNADSA